MAAVDQYVKKPKEIEGIRASAKILARVIEKVALAAEEGVALKDLDALAYGLIKSEGGEPAFLGYRPGGATRAYPATICASLNEVVVHGVPTARRLVSGDILKIDLGVKFKGYYSDAARTIPIGKVSDAAKRLINGTRAALQAAIAAAKPGRTLGDIGHAIKKIAAANKLKVVKGLTGHGVGSDLHEDPVVYNEGSPGRGALLRPGMVLAIEPMFSLGSDRIRQLKDESYATLDRSLSAHFEDTILITTEGGEVLTVI